MRRLLRLFLMLLFGGMIAAVVFIHAAGEMLSRPARSVVGKPPADLPAEIVEFRTAGGGVISGWWIRSGARQGAILLLHGIRGDRRSMIGRTRFLRGLGYSVLLVDLPAHGESSGERITFGRHESLGVDAALLWLAREAPAQKIGVIGVSLGAASMVFSHPAHLPDAVILESMFPTIEEAVADRLNLHLGAVGEWLAPLLTWQLPWRLGFSTQQLRPIDATASLRAPLMIVSGAADRHTTLAETKRIFDTARMCQCGERKLWIVDGAAHVDLHGFAKTMYEEKIGAFLAAHLSQ
ncbi:MAG: alpha/beta hydrolase [Betaproteobacteria bacterium]